MTLAHLVAGALLLGSPGTHEATFPENVASPHSKSSSSSPAARRAADHEAVRKLLKGRKWQAALELLEPALRAAPEDPEVLTLYGEALYGLGRKDEAAHQLARALELTDPQDKGAVRATTRLLDKADPLAKKRRSFFNGAARLLADSCADLFAEEHLQLAVSLSGRIGPILDAERRAALETLAEEALAAVSEVDLDAAGAGQGASARRPLVTIETEHFVVKGNLERDVVELTSEVMEDVHDYFLRLYFAEEPSGIEPPRTEIRIHGTHAAMMAGYPRAAPVGGRIGGWFSPTEDKVECYDTRNDSGSLDAMLETLFHEVNHVFVRVLTKRGGFAPGWINEGTSCFFEGARAMQDNSVLWPEAAVPRLDFLSQMLGGGGPRVREVVGCPPNVPYPGPYYYYAWGLVYYFMEWEDPRTLERPYRPLYREYLERITTQAQDPLKLFEEVFLGSGSPRGHADFDAFVADWREWIQKEVRPLHLGNARRGRRTAELKVCLTRADQARERGDTEREAELLERALAHTEAIVQDIDADHVDGEIVIQQIRILQRLDRPKAEAPRIDQLLDLVDRELHHLDPETYAELEKRLKRISRRYAALRLAKSRTNNLARDAEKLLADYEEEDPPMIMRAWTFAATAGALLDDTEGLLVTADRLRARAFEAGLIQSAARRLAGGRAAWSSIFPTQSEKDFRPNPVSIAVESEGGAFAGRVLDTLPVSGEYVLRTVLQREGDLDLGSYHALVVSATRDGQWLMTGLDHEGQLVVKSATLEKNGNVTHQEVDWDELDPPVAADEVVEIAIHVYPEGRLEVTVGERETIEFDLPTEMPEQGLVGVFVQGGRAVFREPTIEVFP